MNLGFISLNRRVDITTHRKNKRRIHRIHTNNASHPKPSEKKKKKKEKKISLHERPEWLVGDILTIDEYVKFQQYPKMVVIHPDKDETQQLFNLLKNRFQFVFCFSSFSIDIFKYIKPFVVIWWGITHNTLDELRQCKTTNDETKHVVLNSDGIIPSVLYGEEHITKVSQLADNIVSNQYLGLRNSIHVSNIVFNVSGVKTTNRTTDVSILIDDWYGKADMVYDEETIHDLLQVLDDPLTTSHIYGPECIKEWAKDHYGGPCHSFSTRSQILSSSRFVVYIPLVPQKLMIEKIILESCYNNCLVVSRPGSIDNPRLQHKLIAVGSNIHSTIQSIHEPRRNILANRANAYVKLTCCINEVMKQIVIVSKNEGTHGKIY